MKTTYFTLILNLLICQFCFSQVELGVKAGANLANVSMTEFPGSTEILNPKIKLAYHFGVFGSVYLSQKISVSTDLLYSNKGFKTSRDEANLRFHYLNIPLLVNYSITDDLKIGIGPELGYLISVRSKVNNSRVDVSAIYSNQLDIGVDLGLAYSINEQLNSGIRYNHGFSSVWGDDIQFTDEQGNLIDNRPKLENRVFQIYLSYVLKRN